MNKFILIGLMCILLINIGLVLAEVRINEVELNPEGSDSGYEWIELYSDEEIDLNGWKLVNNDGQEIDLDQSFQGYLLINLEGQWLDNSDEKVMLKNSSKIISETDVLDDSNNDGRTWNYCDEEWLFYDSTKNSENNCESENNPDDGDNGEIFLEISWDKKEIVNGEKFDIEIIVENLEDEKYDVKVWIEDDDGNIISERYDEENEKWKSGNYYLDEFFKGPGDEKDSVELRIKEEYEDFDGDATIFFKVRGIEEIEEDIEVIKEISENKLETETVSTDPNDPYSKEYQDAIRKRVEEYRATTGNVISLGNKNLETEDIKTKGNIIYESKTETIKKYSVFSFALLCVALVILLAWGKLK